jgi:hypothetical protein
LKVAFKKYFNPNPNPLWCFRIYQHYTVMERIYTTK